jgi:hypothetical protein
MRKKNTLALQIFEKHYEEKTQLIHMGPVAPILENLFYALSLFRKKEQKTMLEGKDLILRMIRFQSMDGLFPDAIHLLGYPSASWKKNALIAAVLDITLHQFDKVIDRASKEQIIQSKQNVLCALDQKNLPLEIRFLTDLLLGRSSAFVPKINSFEDLDLFVVARTITQNLTLQQQIDLCFNTILFEGLRFYHGPFKGVQQLQGFATKSLLEVCITPDEDLKLEPAISDTVWMSSVIGCDLSHLEGKQPFLRHREPNEEGDILFRAFLDHEKGCSACMVAPRNTTYDSKTGVYTATLEGLYEEDAHEIALYVTLDPSIKVYLDQQTSSVFSANQVVAIQNLEKQITFAFRSLDDTARFIGHISLDSKPYELEKGGFYDRKISIRTVERPARAQLEIFIGWNGEKCPF